MKYFKEITVLSVFATLACGGQVFASSNSTPSSVDESEKQNITVPQKLGREAARIDEQAKDAIKDAKSGWKGFKQKHKHKEEKKK